jgi:hypothetical protein
MSSSAHRPRSIAHDAVAMDGTGYGAGADVGGAPLGRWMDAGGGRAIPRRAPTHREALAIPPASRGGVRVVRPAAVRAAAEAACGAGRAGARLGRGTVPTRLRLRQPFQPRGHGTAGIVMGGLVQPLWRIAADHAIAREAEAVRAIPSSRLLVRLESLDDAKHGGKTTVRLAAPVSCLDGQVYDDVTDRQARRELSSPAKAGDRRPVVGEVRLASDRAVDEGLKLPIARRAHAASRERERPVGVHEQPPATQVQ